MQLGMIGLGRMGANMVRRLIRKGHACVVYDRSPEAAQALAADGPAVAKSVDEFVARLSPPRAAWLMVPAGAPTDEMVTALGERMARGDTIVDGGNSFYKDDVRRAVRLSEKGIHYVDAGVSGGVWGLERGYCLMVGGPAEAVRRLEPVLRDLAPGRGEIAATPGRDRSPGTAEEGFLHCGPSGAGHFVKMIHNGIEYGLMQAYAEGFDLLRSAGAPDEEAGDEAAEPAVRYDLDLPAIAELWRRGSVVGSWLLDLIAGALLEDPALGRFTGFVHDSGEGRWTIQAALERGVPAEILASSLFARFRSRRDHTFGEKLLSAMRYQFGGHRE